MYTQCPHCDAIFQLSTAQLKAANGDVRCGQCLTVFSALDHLSDDLPSVSNTPPSPGHDSGHAALWDDDGLAAAPTADGASEAADDSPTTTITDSDEGLATSHAESASPDTDLDTVLDASTVTTSDTPDTDIFSEIIAEASQHTLPSEEIDRFEEFLSADSQTALDAANIEIDADVDIDIDSNINADGHDGTAGASTDFDTDHIDRSEPATADAFSDTALDGHGVDERETIDTEFDNAFAAEIALDAADELAELDAFLSATEATPDERSAEPLTAFGHGGPADFDSDSQPIIIEEADLAPIDAAAYRDIPAPGTADPLDTDAIATDAPIDRAAAEASEVDDFAELAAAAAEVEAAIGPRPSAAANTDETPPPDSQQTLNVPQLILDDLHAARAEQLRPSRTPWVVGSLLLILTLVLQMAYFSRDELARDASLRPWLIQLCQLAGCSLSQPYDIAQIEIIGREVRSHPSARKALIASTSLINHASFVQPYPLVTVVFSDINGKPMALRRFTPREYLSNNADLAAGMTPDMPVRIELELVDPGKAAVNYEFSAELDPRNTRPLT
ncbi:MAG: DUF3426 domain-containing protein [Gammaproteobacteria bacterium]|nr:DUF3426 domain-containing protein [Gammaproteobacteria bacterium]